MDLAFTRETYAADDLRWLGSKEGTNTARPVRLNHADSSFNAVKDAVRGVIPAGTPLAEAGNGYVRFTGAEGTTLAGFLLGAVKVPTGAVIGDVARTANGALLDRGRVVPTFVPGGLAGAALTAARTNTRFVFVTHDGPEPVAA